MQRTWVLFALDERFSVYIEVVTAAVTAGRLGPDRVNVVVVPTDDGSAVKWIEAPEMETTRRPTTSRGLRQCRRPLEAGVWQPDVDWHRACSESRNAKSP